MSYWKGESDQHFVWVWLWSKRPSFVTNLWHFRQFKRPM